MSKPKYKMQNMHSIAKTSHVAESSAVCTKRKVEKNQKTENEKHRKQFIVKQVIGASTTSLTQTSNSGSEAVSYLSLIDA